MVNISVCYVLIRKNNSGRFRDIVAVSDSKKELEIGILDFAKDDHKMGLNFSYEVIQSKFIKIGDLED